MKKYCKILCFFGLQLVSVVSHAQQINVDSISYSATGQQMRMLFKVTAAPRHRVFVMNNPSRLVIDLKNASLGKALTQPSPTHPLFAKIRAAAKNDTDLRFVVDLKKPVTAKNFALSSNNKDAHRLVIELADKAIVAASSDQNKAASKPKAKETSATKLVQPVAVAVAKQAKAKQADAKSAAKTANPIVIAIDAGHGGDDPGAHGPNGTEEKVVTFAIAKRLAALINGQAGMKAVMVRKGDYYVGLRNRMQIARMAKADLFISIHADAFQDSSVKGASVYTLSRSGASSEAAHWLAQSENAADLVGGVSLSDKEDVLASVLLDLSQTATQEASVNIANSVLKSFEGVAQLHKDSVQKAGFIVLKSPDVPSILVETAFISNPSEEQNLLSIRYQAQMANAIFKGVFDYFKQSGPVDSKLAKL